MRLNNLYNDCRSIYVFWRDDNSVLKATKYTNFFPYYYTENPSGPFKSFNGKSLQKVIVSKPSDIRKQRNSKSWEADIPFCKKFLIDKVDQIEKSPLVYAFIDIEVAANELPNVSEAKFPISCISIWDSLTKNLQTFFLPEYETEYLMIEDFIAYMRKIRPDLLLGWNMLGFDYPYMHNRIPDLAQKLSIINKDMYGKEDTKYPAGMSILCYLQMFQKFTLNKEKMYSLDHIAQVHLKEEANKKIDFTILNEDLKKKNINDVMRMVKLEEKFHIIDYFDEIRRTCKIEFNDILFNSRMIEMLLFNEAKRQKVVLPNKPVIDESAEKEEFEGAYRELFQAGRFENVFKADLSSAYPASIINFCLSPENANDKEGIKIENTYFKQNENALLPTVIKKLVNLKGQIKKEVESLSVNDPKYKDKKIAYEAIKSVANSAYGVSGLRFFRLFDVRVASATTHLVRSLLHYVKNKMNEKGYKVLYCDTDEIQYLADKEQTAYMNTLVQEWGKTLFNKEKVDIEFEHKGKFQ